MLVYITQDRMLEIAGVPSRKEGHIGGRLLMTKCGIGVDKIMTKSECYRKNHQELIMLKNVEIQEHQ